jgi:ABC-type transport system involved in cytochrome bd biosynthesis fused ATPase/permease subunit
MEQSKLLREAKDATVSFSHWLDEKVAPTCGTAYALELAEWRKEFGLIKSLIESPDRLQIALVGTTGAGKSTFLNAVLGQEILPLL